MLGNNIVRSVGPKSVFASAKSVISSASSIQQGALVIFDDTTNLIRIPATEAECATFVGVMTQTIVLGKIPTGYVTDVDASAAISDISGPAYGVEAKLTSKTGVAWAPGDLVYADPATGQDGVTSTGTKAIGVYQGGVIASAVAGQQVVCLIGTRFPADALKF